MAIRKNTAPPTICIDCSDLPFVRVLQLALGLGYSARQDGNGRVHFERNPHREPNRPLLRALELPTLNRRPQA